MPIFKVFKCSVILAAIALLLLFACTSKEKSTESPDSNTSTSAAQSPESSGTDTDNGSEQPIEPDITGLIRTFTGHTNRELSVAFSPDGRYVLSGSLDNTLRLWDIETGDEIRTFTGHTNFVWSVAFSPDGRYALSGSGDTTLKLWNLGLNETNMDDNN